MKNETMVGSRGNMMKAILLERPGPPEALRYTDMPIPAPNPGQVLVRAHAIGVGMPDILLRSGRYDWMPPLPAIPGIEMSGVVEKLGKGVTSLKVGEEVFVSAREFSARGGCYAEYIAADAETLYSLPEGVELEDCATLSNYQVAWHLLHSALEGVPFKSCLVTAAAGGVGSALVQLGRLAGKQVIGLIDTDEKGAFIQPLGVSGTINKKSENVTDRVKELTSGRGVDVIFDSLGGKGFARQFERLAAFGTIVSYGFLDGHPEGDLFETMRKRMGDCPAVRLFSMHAFDNDPQRRRDATDNILRLLAEGRFKPPIWARMPLADANKAHALLEGGKVLGKIILKP